ncbi:MAG TPA: FHA domain-containing protein [Gammaproteobacteria bacterium]|nr:FHA domain-containing protein [Gammaproteobacteria bacterium]
MARMVPVLVALTGEARLALSGAAELRLTRFPFRVGRESRSPVEAGVVVHDERRRQAVAPNNNLYIWDPGPLLNVSREHFQIERGDVGKFSVRDRGSTCGTLVGNIRLGAGGAESCLLSADSTIVVGTPQSPFVFRFEMRKETRDTPADERLESTSAREKAQLAWNLKSSDSTEN